MKNIVIIASFIAIAALLIDWHYKSASLEFQRTQASAAWDATEVNRKVMELNQEIKKQDELEFLYRVCRERMFELDQSAWECYQIVLGKEL